MRRDVQEIFRNTPHEKQVMMFSATLSKEIRPVCKKFMQDVGIHYIWGKDIQKFCQIATDIIIEKRNKPDIIREKRNELRLDRPSRNLGN